MDGNAPCGTVAGSKRHYRRGEVVCRPCKDAANEKHRERYAAQGRKDRPNGHGRAAEEREKGWRDCSDMIDMIAEVLHGGLRHHDASV